MRKSSEPVSKRFPVGSLILLAILFLCCGFAELLMNHDPLYLDLSQIAKPPSREFYFGTDYNGRDLFSMIWYGGRISLSIGVVATIISTAIAVVYGTLSGLAVQWLGNIMMRITELFLSIPSILLVVFFQTLFGEGSIFSVSLVIGLTSWTGLAKIVYGEICQFKNSPYILTAKSMGAGFFYLLWKHYLPNLLPAMMFTVISNIGAAIVTESTLSFLGIGLPVESVSWGSLLAQADQALFSNRWWLIVIPGAFLAITLLCITNLGNYMRKRG